MVERVNEPPRGKPTSARPPVRSASEAIARLKESRQEIINRKNVGLPAYKPKYSDEQLLKMAAEGVTANERFLVSIQTKNTSADAKLAYQRDSGLAPTWTTSFDQIEAADSDPKLIHQVLGADSNFDPNKKYVMHKIDRGENLDAFGNNTIVPTWDKIGEASKQHLSAYDSDVIGSVMSSDYQAVYASKMDEFWSLGGKEFDEEQIKDFASGMSESDRSKFFTRHKIRTEIGANSEFTGNGLTANTAPGGGKYGVVETLSMDYYTPTLSSLQSNGTVTTIDLIPINGV